MIIMKPSLGVEEERKRHLISTKENWDDHEVSFSSASVLADLAHRQKNELFLSDLNTFN